MVVRRHSTKKTSMRNLTYKQIDRNHFCYFLLILFEFIIDFVFLLVLVLDLCLIDGPAEALVDLDSLALRIQTWPLYVVPGLINDLFILRYLYCCAFDLITQVEVLQAFDHQLGQHVIVLGVLKNCSPLEGYFVLKFSHLGNVKHYIALENLIPDLSTECLFVNVDYDTAPHSSRQHRPVLKDSSLFSFVFFHILFNQLLHILFHSVLYRLGEIAFLDLHAGIGLLKGQF